MLRIKNAEVFGFEAAYRGMRNPLNSWNRSTPEADLALAKKLITAGTEHRKFLRMIYVTVDVTSPLYWWKEYDTYKVGTTANSCSTMHKLTDRPFILEDFSFEDWPKEKAERRVAELNAELDYFCSIPYESRIEKKRAWRVLISDLPSGYMQRRTLGLNYEVLLSIHRQRKGHKLSEWHTFCDWIESLPSMSSFLEAAEGDA
jgi:hypothetical protein